MNEPWRRALELILKVLVAFVAALAGLWLLGVVFSFIGGLLLGIAAFIIVVLRVVVPLALLAGFVYLIVWLLNRPGRDGQLAPKDSDSTAPFMGPETNMRATPLTPLEDVTPLAATVTVALPADSSVGMYDQPAAPLASLEEPVTHVPIEPIVDTRPAVTPAEPEPSSSGPAALNNPKRPA